jgi:hypothetical protein
VKKGRGFGDRAQISPVPIRPGLSRTSKERKYGMILTSKQTGLGPKNKLEKKLKNSL